MSIVVLTTTDEEEYQIEEQLASQIGVVAQCLTNEKKEVRVSVAVSAEQLDKVLFFLESQCHDGDESFVEDEDIPSLLQASTDLQIPSLQSYCESCLKREFILREIPWEVVCSHTSDEDCWLVIDYCIYDVSRWLPKHPGGVTLLNGLGKDATYYFELYHRSAHAFKLLKKYFVGYLKKSDYHLLPPCEAPSENFLCILREKRGHPVPP